MLLYIFQIILRASANDCVHQSNGKVRQSKDHKNNWHDEIRQVEAHVDLLGPFACKIVLKKVYNKLWILFQPQSLKEDSKLNLNVANNNDTIFILLLFACNAGQLYPAAFVAKNANGLTYA